MAMAGGEKGMDAVDRPEFPAGLRVLAVDADPASLITVWKLLLRCKYDVTAATKGEDALQMLRERKGTEDQFDLVITDVHMPGMDGFELLKIIGLEMNIPVVMLTGNQDMAAVLKGIKHGACDYLVKPVTEDQVRDLSKHVVRMCSVIDEGGQNLQPGNADGENEFENNARKYLRRRRMDWNGTQVDNENTSTQKRQRIQWSGQLHSRFVEVVNDIGVDKVVPKTILEKMNVDGLTRENVASHLQKYRIYLKKLSNSSLKEEPWWKTPTGMNGTGSFTQNSEIGRDKATPSFPSSSISSNPFARMNSTSAFGTCSSLLMPTQSVKLMTTQTNLGTARNDIEPVGLGGSLHKKATIPGSQKSITGNSDINMSCGGLPGSSKLVCPSPSGSSFANSLDGMVFNKSISSTSGSSGNSLANISNGSPPQVPTTGLTSYASMLRRKIQGACKGIPVDDDESFENIADGYNMASQSLTPEQSPELANKDMVQMQSSSVGILNKISTDLPRFAGDSVTINTGKTSVPPEVDDLGCMGGSFEGPSQGNNLTLNQLSGFVASCDRIPTFGNVFQNQMTADVVGSSAQVAPVCLLGSNAKSRAMPTDNVLTAATTPMVYSNGQVSSINLGSNNASSTAMLTNNYALGSSAVPDPILNGEVAMDSLNGSDSTCDLQALIYELNNNDESLAGASKAHEMSFDVDHYFDGLFTNGVDDFMDANS